MALLAVRDEFREYFLHHFSPRFSRRLKTTPWKRFNTIRGVFELRDRAMLKGLFSLLCIAGLGVIRPVTAASGYREHLTLQPLPKAALLASFVFQSNSSLSEFEQQTYSLLPRAVGQILHHTHTEELHLRFALGRWDSENWGERPYGGRNEGGTGVELWAWVHGRDIVEAKARWFSLTNSLSGLFCASLNFVDETKTIQPVAAFDREGNRNSDDLYLLHGALPHEIVCTENLTPFLKLLPCKGKAGISSLLDGHKLFDASWQTMAVNIHKTCTTSDVCQVHVEQTVDMVLDLERSMRPNKDPIPRPLPLEQISCNTTKSYNAFDTCFPNDKTTEQAWSIKEVFGRTIQGACSPGTTDLDMNNEMKVLLSSEREVLARSSDNKTVPASMITTSSRSYKLDTNADLDLIVEEYPLEDASLLSSPSVRAERTFTGYGQEHGGVQIVISNFSPHKDANIVYLESLPWFMKPYLHTLQANIKSTLPSVSSPPIPASSHIKNVHYRAASDRKRGTHLELTLSIPPSSFLTLTYDFDKAILRYTEYPPDANRGFDVAPAILRILSPHDIDNENTIERNDAYIRTTSLLLPLPTPDFSMPYNVIILTSTIIAMGFGSIFNLLTRRFVTVEEAPEGGVALLKERLMVVKNLVREKFKVAKGDVDKKLVNEHGLKGMDGVHTKKGQENIGNIVT